MVGKQRNFGLDVLRAFSIILVLIAHKIHLPVELGILGVQVFFILSGFLIGQILIKDFKNGGDFKTVLNFWKRRWFRTLPLYYLVLTTMLIFKTNPFGWKIIVYYFFLQANFVGIDFFHVTWSLVVEEWFYIFLPLATLVFLRKGIRGDNFSYFLSFFIVLFFCCRFFWNYSQKGVIIYQFDCLLLGVLMAHLKVHFNIFYMKLNNLVLAMAGLAGVIYLISLMGDVGSHSVYDTFYKVTWYLLLSFCICLVVPYMEQSAFVNSTISRSKVIFRFLTWTSILSYSIYLIHPSVYSLELINDPYLNTGLQLIILYSVTHLLFVFFERPVMNLRDEFSFEQYKRNVRLLVFR